MVGKKEIYQQQSYTATGFNFVLSGEGDFPPPPFKLILLLPKIVHANFKLLSDQTCQTCVCTLCKLPNNYHRWWEP